MEARNQSPVVVLAKWLLLLASVQTVRGVCDGGCSGTCPFDYQLATSAVTLSPPGGPQSSSVSIGFSGTSNEANLYPDWSFTEYTNDCVQILYCGAGIGTGSHAWCIDILCTPVADSFYLYTEWWDYTAPGSGDWKWCYVTVTIVKPVSCDTTVIGGPYGWFVGGASVQLSCFLAVPHAFGFSGVHPDTVSTTMGDPFYCPKAYTFSQPWLTFTSPQLAPPANNEILLTSNAASIFGFWSVTTTVSIIGYTTPTPVVESYSLTLIHPCAVTAITTTGTVGPITYAFGTGPMLTPVSVFSDSETDCYGTPTCNLVYSISANSYGATLIAGSPPQIQVETTDPLLQATSTTLTITATESFYQTASGSISVTLNVSGNCNLSTISFTAAPAPMTAAINTAAVTQAFAATTDQLSIQSATANYCGLYTYSIVESYPFVTVDPATGTISVASTSAADVGGPYTVTLQAILSSYPTIVGTVQFQVTIIDPCPTTVLSLPTALTSFTISAFDMVGFTQTFSPATDTASTTYTTPGLCGPVAYKILETAPYMSIVTPALPLTDPWTLTALSNSFADVGVWTITLQAELVNDPTKFATTQLTATILDPCPTTVLTLPALTSFTISAFDGVGFTQTFVPATDSASTTAATPGLCGPVTYTILETLPFMSLLSPAAPITDPWTLTALSNSWTDVKVWTMTLQATLDNFPTITTTTTLTATILDPCAATVLTLPTALASFTITAFDGIGFTQTFMPATDSASTTAGVLDLCGPVSYAILEAQPLLFMSITTPANPLTDPFTLAALSNSFADIGVWAVTIQATLVNYPTIIATSALTATVQDPCLGTIIQPLTLTDMTISIYDTVPLVQSFFAAGDSYSLQMATIAMCGDKTYTSSHVLAVLAPPASGLINEDYWTISSLTNNIADVGMYAVTITVGMATYSTVNPLLATFTLTVVDPCATALIDSLSQSVPAITYIVLLATGPSIGTFMPFSDNVAVQYANPPICGPKVYTILEAYTFTTILPPASGLVDTDPWTIEASTTSLLDVGVYTATIQCTLANYPLAPPVDLPVQVIIMHPCETTLITPLTLLDMNFNLGTGGDTLPVIQLFSQFEDSVATLLLDPALCGERVYTLTSLPFLSLVVPVDPWISQSQISVFTTDTAQVGVYPVTLDVSLFDWPNLPPLSITFTVNIVQLINNLPTFSPLLAASATIQMTTLPASWSFPLPPTVDADGDLVSMSVSASGASWLYLGTSSLEIDDISKISPGMYLVNIYLNDGKNTTMVPFALNVLAPPVVATTATTSSSTTSTTTTTTATTTATTSATKTTSSTMTKAQIKAAMQQLIAQKSAGGKTMTPKEQALLEQAFLLAQSLGMSLDDLQSTTGTGKNKIDMMTVLFDWQKAFADLEEKKRKREEELLKVQNLPKPPNPYYKMINSQGKVLIGFSSEVYQVPTLLMINNGTIFLSPEELPKFKSQRKLQAQSSTKKKYPILAVEVIPGLDSNATALSFKWNVTAQDPLTMAISLYFDNPMAVSSNAVRNQTLTSLVPGHFESQFQRPKFVYLERRPDDVELYLGD